MHCPLFLPCCDEFGYRRVLVGLKNRASAPDAVEFTGVLDAGSLSSFTSPFHSQQPQPANYQYKFFTPKWRVQLVHPVFMLSPSFIWSIDPFAYLPLLIASATIVAIRSGVDPVCSLLALTAIQLRPTLGLDRSICCRERMQFTARSFVVLSFNSLACGSQGNYKWKGPSIT